ncbi:MAG: XdhC family protein [Microthrixaceae bacterium]
MSEGTYAQLAGALRAELPVALATVISGPHTGSRLLVGTDGRLSGAIDDEDLDRVVERDALGELAAGRTGVRHYGEAGQTGELAVTVFIECFASPPEMLLFGAMDFTGALVRVAKVLGYRVTVCDAREVFATRQRFPQADSVVVDWPHRLLQSNGDALGERDAICVLTHDARFDVPALLAALKTNAGYIGAMGSRRTNADRIDRLRAEGTTEGELLRIHAPIGLDLGARTPEETAISICAEVIAARTGRTAGPLGNSAGPIH